MRNLPPAIIQVLRHFELMFCERVWEWARILLVGAILVPGKRTVTSALRVMGLSQERQYQNFHTLFAHQLLHGQPLSACQAAWYVKETATFADTLAFVRQQLWPVTILWMSPHDSDIVKVPRRFSTA